MSTTRWTIRAVEDEIIEQVRALQFESGFTLGQIVSAAIRHGLATARQELATVPLDDLPFDLTIKRTLYQLKAIRTNQKGRPS